MLILFALAIACANSSASSDDDDDNGSCDCGPFVEVVDASIPASDLVDGIYMIRVNPPYQVLKCETIDSGDYIGDDECTDITESRPLYDGVLTFRIQDDTNPIPDGVSYIVSYY